MTKPLFSIITVTLNNLNGLKKTHQTISSQACQDFEWIIIDGASTDGTVDYLNAQNIHHISEKDSGIYDAMNKGLKHITGHYALFLNAGDSLAESQTLQRIKQSLNGKKYDFIYGDSLEESEDAPTYKKSRPHTKVQGGMFTHHQAMIYKTNIAQQLTYNKAYQVAADYDFTWCALNNAKDILYLNFPLCVFEAGGLSQQQVLKGRIEQFKIRKTHGMNIFSNLKTFTQQTLAYRIRIWFPKIYWRLKR